MVKTKVRCLFVAMLIFYSAFVSYHITNGVETNRAPSISPIIVQDAEPRQEETEEPLSDDIIDYEYNVSLWQIEQQNICNAQRRRPGVQVSSALQKTNDVSLATSTRRLGLAHPLVPRCR